MRTLLNSSRSTTTLKTEARVTTGGTSHLLFDEQQRIALVTIADVEASGLWPGWVVTEVSPASAGKPEHRDTCSATPTIFAFVRPGWKLLRTASHHCGPAFRELGTLNARARSGRQHRRITTRQLEVNATPRPWLRSPAAVVVSKWWRSTTAAPSISMLANAAPTQRRVPPQRIRSEGIDLPLAHGLNDPARRRREIAIYLQATIDNDEPGNHPLMTATGGLLRRALKYDDGLAAVPPCAA